MAREKQSGIKHLYIGSNDILTIRYSKASDVQSWNAGDLYKVVVGEHLIVGLVIEARYGRVLLGRWDIVHHKPVEYIDDSQFTEEFKLYMADRY